ncbi:MAG: response regulator receiver protein [Polyangiaceae bacterium]|jgi:CheY-like chemotaxis protein|nr:response regulator receiver protein [Polyangiaceae bacterium]
MRLHGLTILLVEDDADNLELIGSFLEDEGARTLCAGSIASALALSAGERVDVVVSDLELADGDGCGLLAALRSRDGGDVPAIAVTGYSTQTWRTKAANCGFVRYALKPFSLETLAGWICELTRDCGSSDAPSASYPQEPRPAAASRSPR